jgi:hypothetical protein
MSRLPTITGRDGRYPSTPDTAAGANSFTVARVSAHRRETGPRE